MPAFCIAENGKLPISTAFLSPRVQGEFSVRQNLKHVHIVQTKVGVLSLPHAKLPILLEFPVSPIPARVHKAKLP